MIPTASFGVNWIEVLFILLSGSGWLGMPPGERDPALLKAAPQQTLCYFEWAGRAAGQPGAAGIDGLAADPEVIAFFEALDLAFAKAEYPDADEDQQRLQQHLPRLVKLLTAHPGCLSIGFEPLPPGQTLLNAFKKSQSLTEQFRIGLVSSAGSDAELLFEALGQLTETELEKQPRMQEVAVPGIALKFTVHREADRVLIGLGEGSVERVLACLRGAESGLDTNPQFQTAWTRVAPAGRIGTDPAPGEGAHTARVIVKPSRSAARASSTRSVGSCFFLRSSRQSDRPVFDSGR